MESHLPKDAKGWDWLKLVQICGSGEEDNCQMLAMMTTIDNEQISSKQVHQSQRLKSLNLIKKVKKWM